MPESSVHPLESILRLCAAKAPEPWYPSAYAKETGTARETLDPHLDQLRMAGLIRLTDWVSGHGQGYALTPAGEEILKSPRQLARLAAGKWSPSVRETDDRPSGARLSPWERGEAVREALMYPVQPVVTFVLIIVNIVAFILQQQNKQFVDLLIVNPFGLIENQWWRLLTTAFLHGGTITLPWHLAMNMYALYNLGRVTESIWGHWRFLAIYLVAAFGGSCLALAIQPVTCVGASGAICGIFAAWAGWLFYNRQHLPPPLFRAWQQNFLINVVLLVLISFVPNVSWEGHLGGAIAGLAVALCFTYFQSQAGWLRWFQWVAVIVVPIVSFVLLLRAMDRSSRWLELRNGVKAVEEIRDFNDYYLPQVQSSLRKARQTEENVAEQIDRGPTRRDAEEVKEGIAELSTAIDSLADIAGELRRAGPFVSPLAEEARIAGLNNLEARLDLLRLIKECLEKGKEWNEKDEKRLAEQRQEATKAEGEWQALLR